MGWPAMSFPSGKLSLVLLTRDPCLLTCMATTSGCCWAGSRWIAICTSPLPALPLLPPLLMVARLSPEVDLLGLAPTPKSQLGPRSPDHLMFRGGGSNKSWEACFLSTEESLLELDMIRFRRSMASMIFFWWPAMKYNTNKNDANNFC